MDDARVTREWHHEGQRLVYDEYGSGDRTFILIHGLLLARTMHEPLARDLARRGHRVIVPDLLGHGTSDRPRDMWRYSMPFYGEQMLALMDHLGVEECVMGGTSLGANTTLEAAVRERRRLRGIVIEMPVLDNALLGCALGFTPLLVWLTFGEPVARLTGRLARLVPRGLNLWADVALDVVRQDPAPAAALMQGLFFGRIAPHRSERATIETPALVIGHPRDPIHPFSDADMLVRELPDARLVEASSILELRFSPDRLTDEIARFLDDCWERPAQRRMRAAAGRPAARARRAAG